MSKGIIKEKKPQTLSRWEVLKAWIAESIASIKRSLKDGGWKGTALGAATLTSAVGAGIVLVACVPTEVQIEKVTSESEVNRLVSANFSEEDAVRDEMTKQYGALSDFEYNNGKATANVERNGKSYAVSAEIDLGASDFEVTKYTNAELSGNNLTYTSEGQDVSENVSDKIVVEENGVIYVIDPSDALNTISIAVSDAILTENVDPENPGGEENPDPDEPENPGGEENPDPDKPWEGEEGGNVEIENGEYQNFDEFVLDLEGENLDSFKTAVSEALRNGFTANDLLSLFGRGTTLENTKTYQFAFNFDNSGNIVSVQYVAIKDNISISRSTINLNTPISLSDISKTIYSGDIEEIVENGDLVGIRYTENDGQTENAVTIRPAENQMLIKEADGIYSLVDYTDFISMFSESNIGNNVVNNFVQAGSGTLTEANQSYFDLCMPLAVEAGVIDANATLGFVNVQVSGGVIGSEFGNAINANLQFIDLNTNMKYNISILFADTRTNGSTTMLEEMKKAVASDEYRVRAIQDNLQIISGDQIFEFEDALDGVVTYTISAENQK